MSFSPFGIPPFGIPSRTPCITLVCVTIIAVSVVTVIEIGTETAVFRQNRTEPKPRFYASLLAVSKTEQL